MNVFDSFVKKHDYLVCVDSDGCAMDTMNCKHFQCFGPCMVDEWNLGAWRDPILRRWNEINLFQMTRGINRFKGLALALTEIDAQYVRIPGASALREWADTAPTLSHDGVRQAADAAKDADARACLEKALAWSKAVNASIAKLPDEVKIPFAGAKEGLAAAAQFADVAIVSSANRDAVEAEWRQHGLLAHTDIVLAQDCGSKSHCIAQMLRIGYAPDHVLMIGDAPGDCDAAEKNGVYYYPILVGKESASWAELRETGLAKLRGGEYAAYGAEKKRQFLAHLGG